MAPPTILTWEDSGAPQIESTTTEGELYEVFKWALPQLGWTLEYDLPGEFTAAFRNDPIDGSGKYLQVVDDPSLHANNRQLAHAWMYDTMSSATAGTGRTPDNATNGRRIPKLHTPATTAGPQGPRAWYILGDKRRFIFLIDPTNRTPEGFENCTMFMCGDLISLDPMDKPFFMLGATGNPPLIYAASHFRFDTSTGTANSALVLLRDYGDTTFAPPVNFYNAAFGFIDFYAGADQSTNPRMLNPLLGHAVIQKLWVSEVPSTTATTRVDAVVRGYFPGVYVPVGNWQAEFSGERFDLLDSSLIIENLPTEDGLKNMPFVICAQQNFTATTNPYMALLFDLEGGWE